MLLLFGEEFMFSGIPTIIFKFLSCRKLNVLKIKFNLFKTHSMTPKICYMPDWLIGFSNTNFYKMFRMERSTFAIFVSVVRKCDKFNILERKYTGGHYPVDCKVQLLIFLTYLASQDTLFSIGHRFNVSPNTVMVIINKVLFIVLKLKKAYIKFPSTVEEMNAVSRGFKNYPGKLDNMLNAYSSDIFII